MLHFHQVHTIRGVQYFIRILSPQNKLFYFQGGKNYFIFFFGKIFFLLSAKNGCQQKLEVAIHNQAKTRRQGFFDGLLDLLTQ